jgi:hypothetical protein
MVYGLYRALPGARALWPPSPLRSLLLKNLTPASRCQDHTSSHVRINAVRYRRIRVHRIPPRGRDDRDSPLCGTGRGEYRGDLHFGKAEYFYWRDWTRGANQCIGASVLPVGQRRGGRRAVCLLLCRHDIGTKPVGWVERQRLGMPSLASDTHQSQRR